MKPDSIGVPSNVNDIEPIRIHYAHPFAAEVLSTGLTRQINRCCLNRKSNPVIVCIGTDRSTGDSLGPLIGTELSKLFEDVHVYGTLEDPVHATNLEEYITKIESTHYNSPIIAVDACLGQANNIGVINIKPGPLLPGTGVNKQLPPIGQCHIVGVVNVAGFMEYMVLQNTRLSLVVKMAETICRGITLSLANSWAIREIDL